MKVLVNVHATWHRSLSDTPVRTKGQAGACPDRTRAIPCKVRAVTGQFKEVRPSW